MANIIITGANQGIGYYFTEQALKDGNKVAVLDVETDKLEALAQAFPKQLLYYNTDVCDEIQINSAVKEIIAHERRARKALQLYTKDRLENEVWRAYGLLSYARFLSDTETLTLLSKVRLGIDMGLISEVEPKCFSEILIASRTNYLQNQAGNENMSKNEIDRKRADLVRQILNDPHPGQE